MLAQGTLMKFFLSDGEYCREKGLDFPVASELTSSKLLLISTEDSERIVAACGVRSRFNILNLYVREGYRGLGIGKQLLTRTILAAEKRRLGFITLTVYPDNYAAFHLYQKAGFKEISLLKKSNQMIMILPLTLVGELAYRFFRALCLILPNSFVSWLHSGLYRRTLG
jgi:ribosomal protein S18 acetylase RimI-like enzyme